MSKVRFFNSRLYPMVAKAVASGCPATYIVARDDREMVVNIDGPIDRDIFPVMEVSYNTSLYTFCFRCNTGRMCDVYLSLQRLKILLRITPVSAEG